MQLASFPSTFLVRPQIFPTRRRLSPPGKSWRRIMIILWVMSLALLSLTPAGAGDGGLDPAFNPGAGVQKLPIIRGEADWLNGSGLFNGVCLIYGYFTSITDSAGTHNVSSIAKLNDITCTVDTSFNIPVVGEVRGAFLVNPYSATSQIVIWGQFSLYDSVSGKTYYNLARLYWNGSAYAVDSTLPQIFNQVVSGAGIPLSAVNTFAVQFSTGNILVGGYNMQVQGDTTHAYHLIRLLSNYTVDSTYAARALPGGYVTGINLGDGNFPNAARVFGTLPKSGGGNDYMQLLSAADLTTVVASLSDSQVDGPVFGMIQNGANQPWVIWGGFSQAFGTAINRIARIKADLSGLENSTSFNTNIISGGGGNQAVQYCYPQWPNVVIAGAFTRFNGASYGHLARLDANGNVDPTFNNGGSGLDDRPFRLFKPPGSTLRLVGAFRDYNGAGNPRGGIVVLDNNGAIQPPYANFTANSNTPGTVFAVEGGNGFFVIGGDFTGSGGKYHQNLAKLNYDGSTDHSFVFNVEGVVNSMRGNESGLLIAGNFGAASVVGRTSLARVNVDYSHYPNLTFSLDNSFNPAVTKANGTVGRISMVDVDESGNIMIMGHFDKIGGSDRTAIARLFGTGVLDTSFNFNPASMPGLTNIRVNAGGNMDGLYPMVGKATYGGVTRGFGARLLGNGALDQSFAIGQSPVPNVILLDGEGINGGGLDDGSIFLCGNFTHINDGTNFTIPRGYIAKFTPNGELDTTWAPDGANGPIYSLYTYSNGKILMGGSFTAYNSTGRNNVARLNPNGSLDTGFDPGSGTNGPVFQVFYDDWLNKAMLGGGFTTYNGTSRPGIARIFSSGSSFSPAAISLLLLE